MLSRILVLLEKCYVCNSVYFDLSLVDARSMAFLRSYVEASHVLAQESREPLAAIDCYDWTDICGKHNITTYPTIRVYRQGRETVNYGGMLDAGAIISTVKL